MTEQPLPRHFPNARQLWDVKMEIAADTGFDLHTYLSALMSTLGGAVVVTSIEKRENAQQDSP